MTSQTPGADLFQAWKALYDQYETTWTKATQEILESETFTKSLSQTREQYLSGRKVSKETMERYWESLRVPTKTDVARVAGMINSLENKIDALEDAHDTLVAQLKRIESKLDALLNPPVAAVAVEIAPTKATTKQVPPAKAAAGRSKAK